MKILCTLPNASEEISGIAFEKHPNGGMVSVDPVPEDVAEVLLSIDGYKAVEEDTKQAGETKQAEATKPPAKK